MSGSAWRRWPCLIVATLALLAAAPVAANPPSAVKVEDTLRVLRSRHDPEPKDFLPVGGDVDQVLAGLVDNSHLDVEMRARAAVALGGWKGPRPEAVLRAAMSDPGGPAELRAAAMLGLAKTSGEVAVEELKAYLQDRSPVLRSGAARALGRAGGGHARILVMAAIENEESLDVREAMEEALKKL
jgi:HEAT repeat protein